MRISNYFDKWVELAGGDKTFKGVSELMVRKQFTNSCPKDVSVFLKERSPKDLEELAKLAEQYLNAHGKKLSAKAPVTKHDMKTNLPRTHKDAMRCYVCDDRSHRAMECPSKASTSRNEPFGHGRQCYCFKCGAMGHEAHECKTALQRSQPGSRAGGRGPGGNPTQAQQGACAMQVPRRSDEKETGLGTETLELKSGEKIKMLNGACMAEIKDNLPMLSGKVGGKKVEMLRYTGCSGVIIRRKLVDETHFPGEMGHIMTVDCTIKQAPMAKVEVDTLFYLGTVEALCLHDPLFDLRCVYTEYDEIFRTYSDVDYETVRSYDVELRHFARHSRIQS